MGKKIKKRRVWRDRKIANRITGGIGDSLEETRKGHQT